MKRPLALAFACCVVLLLGPLAEAATVREMGDVPFPPPACPAMPCEVLAKVTGFQTQIGSSSNPFRATRQGKIVAWTVRLSKPGKDQIAQFKTGFGDRALARLSVLKFIKSKKKGRKYQYRLTAQSELFSLEKYFGSTTTFALKTPLPIRRGYVLALTVPTWLPAFANQLTSDMTWRASHSAAHCNDKPPDAQQTVGSLKVYQCLYRTARILFSATFIPDPKVTNPPK